MRASRPISISTERLRSRAEQMLATTPREVAQMPPEDVQKLVHELQVHQIELEMQNKELRRAQEELQAARDRYADLFDFAPSAILTLGTDGNILGANLAASSLLGLERGDLIRKKFTRFIPADSQDDFYLYQRQVLTSNQKSICELSLVTAKGERLTVQLQGVAVAPPESRLGQWRLTLHDLTGRKQMEDSLRRSEQTLSSFFNLSPIGLVWLSASGTILRVNQAQLDLLGYAAAEYLGRFFNDFGADSSQGQELLERLAAKETVHNFRLTQRCKDGGIRHVLADANAFWSDGEFRYSSVFVRDITGRIALEKEILRISEQEHHRIAHDIHDGLGQLLAGTAYMTDTLQKDLAAKSLPEGRQARRILKVIYEAIAQTRNLARGLHPVAPEPNGLMAALKSLAARTKTMFRVDCRFSCPKPVLIEENPVATHLYRIAQEAITNAIKHGKPGRIEIFLTQTPERLNLAVKDNGVGISARSGRKPGMGLRIMAYRMGMIGGSFAVQREAGGGTSVVCSVHLSGQGNPGRKEPIPARKD